MNRALTALRWSYCAFIAWSSLQTLLHARAGHAWPVVLLAGVEILAIVAFLFDAIVTPACIVLVGVFAIAAVLTTLEGQMPLRFVYFAATAIYIAMTKRAAASRATMTIQSG